MNDAVYKFKRYEDSSLEYTGINKHSGENVGLYDTVLTEEEYKTLYSLQQKSLEGTKTYKPAKDFISSKSAFRSFSKPAENKVDIKISEDKTVVEEKKPITFNTNMVKVGAVVTHKAFGEGKITNIDKDILTIKFKDFLEEKMFEHPTAFKLGFLTLKE